LADNDSGKFVTYTVVEIFATSSSFVLKALHVARIGNVYTCCNEYGLPPMAMPPMAMTPMAMTLMPALGRIVGEKKKVLGGKAYSIIPTIIHH
ncbi:hypothetical protein Tco_1512384, partial [Tanacetum coccineum]